VSKRTKDELAAVGQADRGWLPAPLVPVTLAVVAMAGLALARR
jgi:hypothetical protein